MSILKLNETDARELSAELRTGNSAHLRRRRCTVALSMAGSASLGLIALYQLGILRCLPEPPWPHMNAEKVDASAEAYQRFSMPDAVLGVGSYAATMALAAMGGPDRAHSQPYLRWRLRPRSAMTPLTPVASPWINGPSMAHSASGASLRRQRRLQPSFWWFPKRLRPSTASGKHSKSQFLRKV
jgi:hypothetical protein